jgi:hypothetical protein
MIKRLVTTQAYAEGSLLTAVALPACVAITLWCAGVFFVGLISGAPLPQLVSFTGISFFVGSLAVVLVAIRAYWRTRTEPTRHGLLVRAVPVLILVGAAIAGGMARYAWTTLNDQLETETKQFCSNDATCAASLLGCARGGLLNQPLGDRQQRMTVLRACAAQKSQ